MAADGALPEKILPSDSAEAKVEKINSSMALVARAIADARAHGERLPQIDKAVADLTEQFRDFRAQAALTSGGHGNADGEIRAFVDEKGGKVRMVGGSDGNGVYRSGLLDDDVAPVNEWHAELRNLKDLQGLVRICTKSGNSQERFGTSPKVDRLLAEHMERAPDAIKRVFSGATGAGGDWQSTIVLPMLAEEARQPLAIEGLFDTVEMPAKTVTIPFDSGVAVPYLKGAPSSNSPGQYTASENSTTSRQMVAGSLAVMILLFDDAEEDSVIAARPLLSRKVVDGLRYGREDAILNGDTQSTHQDTLTGWNPRSIYVTGSTFGGPDDHRRAWIGLRAHAFDASNTRDAGSDTSFTTQTLPTARAALAAPHGVSGDLVYATSLEHYLTDIFVDPNVLTADKFMDKATLLAGQLAEVAGVRIAVTEFMTADQAATGLYTGSGSKTSGVLFNRKRYYVGQRRGTVLEGDKDIRNGTHYFVATWRGTFRPIDGYTHKSSHLSYNL